MIQSLCETCASMREVVTPRGSRFLLCQLSRTNTAYPKYPPQPVVRCDGYRPRGKDEDESKQQMIQMQQRQHKTVLFLCTGNYYRSRFAEVLFNSLAGKRGLPWRASSRGLALERGINNVGPMAAEAVRALEAMGVCAEDDCARLPVQVTTGDLAAADRIIALKQAEHLPLFQERFPAWAEKVEFWHIEDEPEVLCLIEQEVMSLVARIVVGQMNEAR
jgi:protein-tyrosine phosphatase